MLAGAGCGSGGCPPANQRSSVVRTSCARLLRRRDCSSELALSSGERPLTGVVLPVSFLPPAGECWPELDAIAEAILRRTRARRRWQQCALTCSGEGKPHRSWCSPPVKGLSPELRLPVIVSPLAGECWPELGWSGAAVPPVNEGLVGVRSTDCAPAPA